MEEQAQPDADKTAQPERDGLNRLNDTHKDDIPNHPNDEAVDCDVADNRNQKEQDCEKNHTAFAH